MMKKLKLYSLPILSGFLIGTSYIPFPPWAILFCIAPLWIFWTRTESLKTIFIAGWITQFILNAIGFHWIAHTTVEFGRMPLPVGLLALLLFCSLAHLYYPIAGVLWKWLTKKLELSETTSLLILPFIFILCERLYPFLFYWHFGYPWLWARLPGFHTAEWIGFFGINLITLIINTLFVLFWLKRKSKQWVHPFSIAAVSLFLFINIIGFFLSKKPLQTDKTLNVIAVQGNIGNLEKIYAQEGRGYIKKIVDTYIDLTEKALAESPETDLVVWPETAFPETLYTHRMDEHRHRLSELTTKYNITLLTGAYQRGVFKEGSRQSKNYNSIVLMKGSENIAAYQKTILLAFGEYLPFAELYPPLKKMLPMVSDFGRGSGPTVLAYEKAKIGVQICYEGLFDEFSTSLQKQDAQILINITNDSWFGYPFEPYQHMYMTLARAVENRIPLLRVTNTGISTLILQNGEVLEHSPRNQTWYKRYEIPIASTPPNTFYVRLSENWPLILILIIGLLIAGEKIARSRKH